LAETRAGRSNRGFQPPGRERSDGRYWEAAVFQPRSEMRSIHIRVEDDLYMRIQEEAAQQGLSVANFARVATVARTILWGVRRGAPWADMEAWGEATKIIEEIERRDRAARAKLAREQRVGRTFREKLERERAAAR
jgi:hypothetical protein